MFVDDHIVLKYLDGDRGKEIKNHWIFNSIEKGNYLFENPDMGKKEDVRRILSQIKDNLSNFIPLNKGIYSTLYPNWLDITRDMNILLTVGCPHPYDAMVREYDGRQYIIFDLIRFSDYEDMGYDIDFVIKQLITHEVSHLCLHKKYPLLNSNNFVEELKHITFDEGFAHLLAFKEDIEKFDFSEIIDKYYYSSFLQLKEALAEKDSKKQTDWLIKSNSGPYWSKFAAISGKLFLANHIEELEKIYNGGIDNFISYMGL